jgi:predicted nucleic acid-binding Zn finger protein
VRGSLKLLYLRRQEIKIHVKVEKVRLYVVHMSLGYCDASGFGGAFGGAGAFGDIVLGSVWENTHSL